MSVTLNVGLGEPVVVGVKVTLMVQVALVAKFEGLRGQLLVCPKSPGLVPVKPMLVMVSATPLVFDSVTALGALVKIGRASWRERAEVSEGAGSVKTEPDAPAV